ncbi:MAG TPA: hypothetical protein VGC54_05825 [Planctomycetota bacterium]
MSASTSETETVGDFRLDRELVMRKKLIDHGLKIAGAFVYRTAWVARRSADGPQAAPAGYFLTQDEAREWARSGGGAAQAAAAPAADD